jgi:hypothetical protein
MLTCVRVFMILIISWTDLGLEFEIILARGNLTFQGVGCSCFI